MLQRLFLLVAAACFACSPLARGLAQDKPADEAEEAAAGDYADLLKQLDADKFSDRQSASTRLAEAGKAAIPALIEGAMSESREASTRSVEILKNHFQKGDEATKKEAKAALEKVAKGQNQAAARRAEDALAPKPADGIGANGLPAGVQIVPGNIQIQVRGIAGGPGVVKRVAVKNINGVKEIEVEENGKKVKILDDPNNGIKIEITEKNKEGKEETKKYEAKNADDLKKNHPEGHKIYEEYSKQPGGLQIQGIQIQNGAPPNILPRLPLPAPNGLRPARIRPAQEDKPANEKIEAAQKRLDEAVESLKKLAQNNAQAEEIARLADLIEAAKKQLEEAKSQAEE